MPTLAEAREISDAYQAYMSAKYPDQKPPKGKFEFFTAGNYTPPRIALVGNPVFVADDSVWALVDKQIDQQVAAELFGKGSTEPTTGWYLVTGKLRLYCGPDTPSAIAHFKHWEEKFRIGDLA